MLNIFNFNSGTLIKCQIFEFVSPFSVLSMSLSRNFDILENTANTANT
jgi:hypothetical protein